MAGIDKAHDIWDCLYSVNRWYRSGYLEWLYEDDDHISHRIPKEIHEALDKLGSWLTNDLRAIECKHRAENYSNSFRCYEGIKNRKEKKRLKLAYSRLHKLAKIRLPARELNNVVKRYAWWICRGEEEG
jgi:hypothetical protein